jgi:hypothetical protein
MGGLKRLWRGGSERQGIMHFSPDWGKMKLQRTAICYSRSYVPSVICLIHLYANPVKGTEGAYARPA